MGKPGPKPQPRKLLLLNGNGDGKDSAGRPIPTPPNFKRLPPSMPTWLSREAKAEWKRVVPALERHDLIKPEDRAALAAYCECWARYVEANRLIRAEGLVLTNPGSGRKHQHPAVAIANTAESQLRAFAAEFGLTPSAERNVSKRNDDRDPDEEDPFSPPAAARNFDQD